MRGRWRPSPEEERWLEVESQLGATVPSAVMAERTGGWRSTGPLARIALFLLGLVAAALILGVLGFRDEITLLVAGLIAAFAAEWLTIAKRLHASGVEEGLCVGGALMIGAWLTTVIAPRCSWTATTSSTVRPDTPTPSTVTISSPALMPAPSAGLSWSTRVTSIRPFCSSSTAPTPTKVPDKDSSRALTSSGVR